MHKLRLLLPLLAAAPASVSALWYGGVTYDSMGCYSSISGMTKISNDGSTSGKCASTSCKGSSVFATSLKACYCGNDLPSTSDEANGKCTNPCPYYSEEMCGGEDTFNFYVVEDTPAFTQWIAQQKGQSSDSASSATAVSSSSLKSSATSSSSTSTGTSLSSSPASATSSSPASGKSASPTSSGSSASSSSSPTPSASSTALPDKTKKSSGISGGAIAGIVIGVVAGLTIIALIFVFMRRRRNNIDYTGSSTPNGFREPFGVKPSPYAMPPSPFAAPPPPPPVDPRLNPTMLGERRISVGSLADARDYSRKILRVANPDDEA